MRKTGTGKPAAYALPVLPFTPDIYVVPPYYCLLSSAKSVVKGRRLEAEGVRVLTSHMAKEVR
jgi:hypothetical protein